MFYFSIVYCCSLMQGCRASRSSRNVVCVNERGWVSVRVWVRGGNRWSQIDRLRSGSARAERTHLCVFQPQLGNVQCGEAGGKGASRAGPNGRPQISNSQCGKREAVLHSQVRACHVRSGQVKLGATFLKKRTLNSVHCPHKK